MQAREAVLTAFLLLGGFLVGLVIGRWWALLAAVVVGLWITAVTEVEVPHSVLGVGYAAISEVGIAAGLAVRRGTSRSRANG